MKKLEPPDTHHLSAASGWLGLGDWQEAALELAKITPDFRQHPDVLEVQYEVCSKARRWEDAVEVAKTIVTVAPQRVFGWVHAAFALHELKHTLEAHDTLLPLVDRFPREWVIRYNLACYACQLGRESDALDWLGKAYALGDPEELKQMALEDPDLEPVRAKIKK